MIPSISDFTSYWRFDESHLLNKYIGILFGENILVYDDQVINLTKLLNDNNRIYNVITNKQIIYVLLDNNNLYTIETTNFKTYELVRKDVKNIFSYTCNIFMLQNNGDVLNDKFEIIYKDVSVVANISRGHISSYYIYGCNGNNEFFRFNDIFSNPEKTIPITNKIIDMYLVRANTIILHDDNTVSIHQSLDNIVKKLQFKNVNCISAISSNILGMIYDDNNVIVYTVNNWQITDLDDFWSYTSISITNSPYCAKFNAQNIPYYPKYFMDRFIAFIMSVKYGCNIKFPKYLYFMIANYLR